MRTISRRIARSSNPKESIAVLQVPGKTKKAAERKASQLLGWMNRGMKSAARHNPPVKRRAAKRNAPKKRAAVKKRKPLTFGQRMARLRKKRERAGR